MKLSEAKIMWKSVPTFIFFMLLFFNGNSQIGGISGSKISAVCVDVVDHKHIEFEPAVGFSVSKKFFDNSGHLSEKFLTPDSSARATELAFRLTYGLWDCFEFGATVASDMSKSDLGVKYILFHNDRMGIAAISGISFPMGNEIRGSVMQLSEFTTSAGAGIVMSTHASENLCLDLNIQGHTYLSETQDGSRDHYYINADAGYFLFSKQLQVVAGIGYSHLRMQSHNQSLLTVYPGITLEAGEQHIVVISCPFDVLGKNSLKSAGICVALTLSFH